MQLFFQDLFIEPSGNWTSLTEDNNLPSKLKADFFTSVSDIFSVFITIGVLDNIFDQILEGTTVM